MRFAVILAFVLSVPTLTVSVAPFIPIVTALAARLNAPGWVKLGVTTIVAAISGVITTAIDSNQDAIITWDTVWRILLTLGIAMGSYLAFRKPIMDPIANAIPGGVVGPKDV